MQRFNARLTLEDQKVVHRIYRIMLLAYASMALVLAADVVAHVALKNPTVANTPAEAITETAAIGGHS
jgi:hypothetical protein